MSEQKNFLGIPVEGDIRSSYARSIPQQPIEDLGPYLEAALAVKALDSIRWTQYTPYFNDGDPCTFGVMDVYFKVSGVPEDEGDRGDGYVGTYSAFIRGGHHSVYDYEQRTFIDVGDEIQRMDGMDALVAIKGAIGSGAFEDALLEAFGDHAEVTIYRDRVEVQEYSHD